MNDFERKLSQQPFRAPPADLREAIFGEAKIPSNVIVPARWTWRDWFWPSPAVWGALAAVWVVFAVLGLGARPAESGGAVAGAPAQPEFNGTLLSYHEPSNLSHVLDFTN